MIISALKNKDMNKLSQYVHPQLGLRFSPYATVKDTDQVFTADKVVGLMDDPTVYLWGHYDGSGEPINLTFATITPNLSMMKISPMLRNGT